MPAQTLSFETTQERRWTVQNRRLQLKPPHGSPGSVQGGWWPRTDQLHTELPELLAALTSRSGAVDRVVYDENRWAPASMRMEFRGHSVILEGSETKSTNTLSVFGKQFGTLVLLVVPPNTDPAAARTAVRAAADPDDVSTAEELLEIGMSGARNRPQASRTQQPLESHSGTLGRPKRLVTYIEGQPFQLSQ